MESIRAERISRRRRSVISPAPCRRVPGTSRRRAAEQRAHPVSLAERKRRTISRVQCSGPMGSTHVMASIPARTMSRTVPRRSIGLRRVSSPSSMRSEWFILVTPASLSSQSSLNVRSPVLAQIATPSGTASRAMATASSRSSRSKLWMVISETDETAPPRVASLT